MDKVEIHRNQVYRLDKRRRALRKLPLLVRRLLHRAH